MAERTRECGGCGGPLPEPKSKGRPRLYCSDSCRRGVECAVRREVAETKRGERARERAEVKAARQATPPATCRKCGVIFQWRLTRGRRPTCCAACSAAWRPAPCASCGKTVPGGGSSLPPGQRMCRACRARNPAPKWRFPLRPCQVCGAEYRAGKRQVTCSLSCGQMLRNQRDRDAGKHGRACDICGTRYKPTYAGQRTCGRTCGALLQARNKAVSLSDRSDPVRVAKFRVTLAFRRDVYERDGYMCWLCGHPVSRTAPPLAPWAPTLDHALPRSKGGPDTADNLRTAHLYCNVMRGDSDPSDVDLPEHPPLFWSRDENPEWATVDYCLEHIALAPWALGDDGMSAPTRAAYEWIKRRSYPQGKTDIPACG